MTKWLDEQMYEKINIGIRLNASAITLQLIFENFLKIVRNSREMKFSSEVYSNPQLLELLYDCLLIK